MKLLHCADVHLDSPLVGLARHDTAPVEAIRGATRRAFENAVQLAIDEDVVGFVIAGDLYDGARDDYNTAEFLRRQLLRLADAGIPVAIAFGNHDAANRITKQLQLRLPANTRTFSESEAETIRWDDVGIALHGRSYPRRDVTEDLARAYPAPIPGLVNIGVLHTCLDGAPGHEPYAPCKADQLAAHGYQYWALGHVHTRRDDVRDHVHLVFPGNVQGRHARECGPKGVTLIEIDGGQVTSVEHRPVDVLRWARVEVDLHDVADEDTAYARVLADCATAIDRADPLPCMLRVQLTGTTPLHDRLVLDRERVVSQVRSDLWPYEDRVWVERVELDLHRPLRREEATTTEAVAAVRASVRALLEQPGALDDLVDALGDLATALPGADVERFEEITGIHLDAEGVRRLLPSVEAEVVAALEQAG